MPAIGDNSVGILSLIKIQAACISPDSHRDAANAGRSTDMLTRVDSVQ